MRREAAGERVRKTRPRACRKKKEKRRELGTQLARAELTLPL